MDRPTIEKPKFAQQFVILMTIFIDATGYAMVIPLLSFYTVSFNLEAFGLGILMVIFALSQFIFSPIMGRLSDKYGRRLLLLISISLSSASFFMFTIATSYYILLFSRMFSGMATEISIAQAYMADITTSTQRTSGLGKVRAAFSAGVVVGPSIGGFLSVFGYWAPGLIAIGLTLLNLIFVYFFLPEPERNKTFNQNIKSTGKSGFLTNLKNSLKKPLLPSLLFVFFIMTLSFAAIPVLMPFLTFAFFDFNEIQLSFVFIYIGALQLIMQGFLIGKLSEKIGEGLLIMFGLLSVLIGMIIMPTIPSLILFFVLLAMLSLGSGLVRTTIPSIISKISNEDEQGGFLGVAQSVASFALIPGPLLAGYFYDYFGLRAPFFFSGILLLLAFLMSFYLYFKLKKSTYEKAIINLP
jgi:DHA1 family tetracycline resistance protein-like MFS transporter